MYISNSLGHTLLGGVFFMVKRLFYLIITLAIVFYALPIIPISSQQVLPKMFSIVWIAFALLIIGAQLNSLLDLDEKKRKDLIKLERYKTWKKEQRILKSQAKSYRRMR